MKQLTVIYLSFTLLLQGFNPGLTDLVKVEDMLQHFEYHSQLYGDNFTDFLSKHYGAAKQAHQEDADDHPDHDHLPFNQQNSLQTTLAFYIPQYKLPLLKLPVVEKHSLNFIYKEGHSVFGNTEIFQPPRTL